MRYMRQANTRGRAAGGEVPALFSRREEEASGMYTGTSRYRSIRDLVSQLWFDDLDEATSGAEGLCDLCVPSNPQAAANRDMIGSTATFFEGCERLLRSASPNAIYHACEALSQVAFKNSRNALRIIECRSPSLLSALAQLLEVTELRYRDDQHGAPSGPMLSQEDDVKKRFLGLNALRHESKCDLQIAILRTLNNCAWISSRACTDIVTYDELMSSIERILLHEMHDSPGDTLSDFSQNRVAVIDSIIGLFNLFSSNRRSREVLMRRRILEDLLLPLVHQSEHLKEPSEQLMCTVASIFEIVVKLIPEGQEFPALPNYSTLKTIVWTLQCSLDGIIWAGITWSPLSRLQTLSRMAEIDEIKIPLIELHLADLLVRVLEQWSSEQGDMILEYCLHTLLCLLTVQEVRFQLYMSGVWSPLRNIVLGEEGIAESAREKAILCAWMLFEWQVEKLEVLDSRSKTLIEKLETSEKNLMTLEVEYATCKKGLLHDLQRARDEMNELKVQWNHALSDLMSYKSILEQERAQNLLDRDAANALISSLKRNLLEREERLVLHEEELSQKDIEINYWKKQAEVAILECRSVYEDYMFALRQRDLNVEEKNKALELAEIRYHEMILQQRIRQDSSNRGELKIDQELSSQISQDYMKAGLEELIWQLSQFERDLAEVQVRAGEEGKVASGRRTSNAHIIHARKKTQADIVALGKACNIRRWKKLENDCYALWLSLENCNCGNKLKTALEKNVFLQPTSSGFMRQSLYYHTPREDEATFAASSATGMARDLLQCLPFSKRIQKQNLIVKLQSARERAVSTHKSKWKRFLLHGEEISTTLHGSAADTFTTQQASAAHRNERQEEVVVEARQYNLV
eukprot:751317-Hanusia_phi.AAC.12